MRNFSAQIESSIKTVIVGLNYDIGIDYSIKHVEEYKEYLGYKITVNRKSGKIKGVLEFVDKTGITISYILKSADNSRDRIEKKVGFASILDARVYREESDLLEAEKMKGIIDSKVSAFEMAKRMLNKWMNSPNAPSEEKARHYITEIVKAGDKALEFLRDALAHEIDYDELEAHKIATAIKAKPIILDAVFELDSNLIELRNKLESGDLSLAEKEFQIGYPERFGKGEFFPIEYYHKGWYNEEKDAVKLCPHSTKGEVIVIDDFKIQLPKKPKKSEILYSDLPKKEQYWRRIPVPEQVTVENKEDWDDYIKEEFRKRREGIWFMNNGKAVYLTGDHYFGLQWCKMLDTGGYMDFRYAQLEMFYHLEACIIDERCLGQLFVKSRRTGFTYIVLIIILNSATGSKNNNYGITSKSDFDAKKAFLKFRYMLLSLPFFFLPLIKGKLDSPKEFEFAAPLSGSKEFKKMKKLSIDDYLNNLIDYMPTKDDSYDGQVMKIYLGDEAFKWKKPHDYVKHLGQVSPTMHAGGEVVGKMFIGSTMGALAKGGQQGKDLYYSSDILERDDTTEMTTTGLYRYFLPAQKNMSAFTDIYGFCHLIKPKTKTYNIKGKEIKVGSIQFLIAQEEAKRKKSDKALNEQFRAYPRTIEHAFRDESAESIFNLTKLYEQIEYNDTTSDSRGEYTVGDFDWEKGVVDADVVFNPNPKGRFKVYWMPSAASGTAHLRNRIVTRNGLFFPLNEEFVRFGCDPFSYKSTHGKGSKGGIHGKTITVPDGSPSTPSNKFVVEYIARPPDEVIFFEDVIKVVKFYGSPILVESNRKDLLRHMYLRGYRGFVMNRLDRPHSKLNPEELKYGGQMMAGQDILDSHMGAIGTWIQNNVGIYTDEERKIRPIGEMGTMPFQETLKDWLAFNPDKRTEFDATISSGLAIMACQKEKYAGKRIVKKKTSMSGFFRKYSNKGDIGKLLG